MALHTTIDRYAFERGFKDMGRDYYSTAGYDYLYETLDELDAEFDVIAVCCDFTEYDDGEALLYDYGYLLDERGETFDDQEEKIEALVDELEYRTSITRLENGGYMLLVF
ncbi:MULTISPECIES: hypothetical protein [unclassified Adlercreutzia]|uniref:hypothetical protein n=1 Tax=unclassified Adlercreutzia TaxID=2636013 RepID=UPI0013EDEFD8|nr:MULTISPECIES: hypothetical protein [unclassified Adlercreutzia]